MLLRYYTDVAADDRILPRVKLHADWLVNLVTSRSSGSANGLGRVPEWWAPAVDPAPPPPPLFPFRLWPFSLIDIVKGNPVIRLRENRC